MISISIVEDHGSTRESFLRLLEREPDFTCAGAYDSVPEALREIPSHLPDVVLMDTHIGGESGIDCVAILKKAHPAVDFLMLTACDDTTLIFEALRAGASGYLLKRDAPTELIAAIKDVARGGSPMSREIARRVVIHFHAAPSIAPIADLDLGTLTAREKGILDLLALGLPYKLIADRLTLSPHTVHNHLRRIYTKLHVQSRTEAVVKFLKRPSSLAIP